jgi:enterochelin esterase family protein
MKSTERHVSESNRHNQLEDDRVSTPILEGETVTFVWYGPRPARLLCDLNDWDPEQAYLLDKAGTQRWAHSLTLPTDAYLEYAFLLDGERVLDPHNSHTTPNGMGKVNNYLYMPGATPTPLLHRRRSVPRGVVTRHVVEARYFTAGSRRTVWLYQPPAAEPCPLLFVLDGQDYLRRAALPVLVENLIAERRIRPLALALVANHPTARGLEYNCSDNTLAFLATRVLPLAQAELNLLDPQTNPGGCGILGASMGGLMALYAGLRAPGLAGRVLSQSGAFRLAEHESVLWSLVQHLPVPPLRIWMEVGRFEWLLDSNRKMHEALVGRGYEVAYQEYNTGHNFPSWRDHLASGLEHLFPPG